MNKTQPYDLEIIAGPCSVTNENLHEIIEEIAPITTRDGKRAIYGTRVVGLKSRTALSADGKGMGMDYPIIQQCLKNASKRDEKRTLPSVEIAVNIAKQTGMIIATEIMIPHIQLPFWEREKTLRGKTMIWNPAVAQLGWTLLEMGNFAKRNNWNVGIKHGKFLGKDPLEVANHPDYTEETSLEKTLLGLTTFIPQLQGDLIIIHRGVDVPGRGNFRSALIHTVMKRVKRRVPHGKLFFDPSHSFGPKMKNHIVKESIEAMKITVNDTYLYDGILIESGTSPTDTDQHITTAELNELVKELSTFRKLREPNNP
jgi:3-deoxy-D-arabino-heptulosonate 7-phosphate (DAHP) synthase